MCVVQCAVCSTVCSRVYEAAASNTLITVVQQPECCKLKCIIHISLQCSAVQCSAVQCSAVQCSAVQCSAVQCNAVQCSAVQWSTVQYSAGQCSAVQWQCSASEGCPLSICHVGPRPRLALWPGHRLYTSQLGCIVLSSAVQCSKVQFIAAHCSAVLCNTEHYSAVQCSAVQCSAVQCSAVQYLAGGGLHIICGLVTSHPSHGPD